MLLLFGLAGAIVAVGTLFIIYQQEYQYEVYRGVSSLGFHLDGLTQFEARAILGERAPSYAERALLLRYRGQTWTTTLRELGAEVDVDSMVDTAYSLGRSGVFFDDIRTQVRLLWRGESVPPVLALNQGKSSVFLGQVAREINQTAHNAALSTSGMEARLIPGRAGRELDISATCERLQELLNTPPLVSEMDLVVREIVPPILDVEQAKEEIASIIAEPLTLVLQDRLPDTETGTTLRPITRCWTLDRAVLASAITVQQSTQEDGSVGLDVGMNRAVISEWIRELAREIDRPPQDARLKLALDRMELTVQSPSHDGLTLLADETIRLIEDALASGDKQLRLAVRVTPPRISLDEIDQLGIRELVSRGETSFAGSSPERAHNIKTASLRFDDVVVLPGETFSFLEHLGPVNPATGYEESWVIFGDRTVLGPGGGVCQVSTTCFRAAFGGGLPVVERWAHTYRVGWYEPPLGLDAAVFSPSVDVKFINDTDHAIMIKPRVDTRTGELAFEFYGTKPDRTIEMEGPELGKRVPKPQPVYDPDPALSPGTVKQVEQGREGIDVSVYRIVRYASGKQQRERFFSRFEPWPDRFLVGPTPVPESAPSSEATPQPAVEATPSPAPETEGQES